MTSIHGNFSIHRIQTPDGKNAVMVVPEDEIPLMYSSNDERDESTEICFEHVEGGENPPDTYLSLHYANDFNLHLGPYRAKEKIM